MAEQHMPDREEAKYRTRGSMKFPIKPLEERPVRERIVRVEHYVPAPVFVRVGAVEVPSGRPVTVCEWIAPTMGILTDLAFHCGVIDGQDRLEGLLCSEDHEVLAFTIIGGTTVIRAESLPINKFGKLLISIETPDNRPASVHNASVTFLFDNRGGALA